MAVAETAVSPYELKTSPYSSHALLLRALPSSGHGRRVLDVGCAGGYLAEILATRGYRVVGVERPGGYRGDIERQFELIEADLECGMPRLAGAFSYILCADILEHLRDPQTLLRQIRDFLEPNGRLVASLPNSGNLYFRLNVLLGRFPAHDRGLFDRTHLHFYMWDGWRDLLARGGFEIESVSPTGVPIGLAFPRWQETRWIRSLEWISYQAARYWKTLFAYQFVIMARAKRVL